MKFFITVNRGGGEFMGTRNLTCVIHNGEFKVAQYCQWDGYIEGQGKDIVEFFTTRFDKGTFIKNLNTLKIITIEEVSNRWKECGADDSGLCNIATSNKFKEQYLHLHRDCGAKILDLIQDGKIKDIYLYVDFAYDSLFCEYCYIINLDTMELEVYKGFNREILDKNERFYKENPDDRGYYGVKLWGKIKLEDLTVGKFLDTFKQDGEE